MIHADFVIDTGELEGYLRTMWSGQIEKQRQKECGEARERRRLKQP